MAKIIKFALELKNGKSARTMEDLRAHFDLEKIVSYFLNGRLATWLRHRHLDAEVDALGKLSSDDAEFTKKLCGILGVDYDEHQAHGETIDADAVKESNERMNALRQVTSAPEILAKIDRVAFDEKDLQRLAFDSEPEVYLCNGRFVIPLNVQNKHYIGLGKAEAVIASEEWVDFEEKGVKFTNVNFDEEYQKKAETPEIWMGKAVEADWAENYDEALKWYRKVADAGFGDAMQRIGNIYHFGKGVSQNYTEAVKWYQKSANAGYDLGMAYLADMYYNGDGTTQDYYEALKWYKLAAEKGFTANLNRIALMYWNGEGTEKDHAEANEWFKKAAEAGNDWGMNNLGNSYAWGNGVPQNYGKAKEWYEKAAEAGNNTSMVSLGDMYRDGKGVAQDYVKAVEWYKKAAEAGNNDGMNRLGVRYEQGQGVQQDYGEAMKWFQKAAEAGNDKALRNIGIMYENGRGVNQDKNEAIEWYKRAADKGNTDAMINIGDIQLKRELWTSAESWYQKAQDAGNSRGAQMIEKVRMERERVEREFEEKMEAHRREMEEFDNRNSWKFW